MSFLTPTFRGPDNFFATSLDGPRLTPSDTPPRLRLFEIPTTSSATPLVGPRLTPPDTPPRPRLSEIPTPELIPHHLELIFPTSGINSRHLSPTFPTISQKSSDPDRDHADKFSSLCTKFPNPVSDIDRLLTKIERSRNTTRGGAVDKFTLRIE